MKVIPIKVIQKAFKNYCYLIFDTETQDAILVDPAWEQQKIENILNIHNVNLKSILITHHHRDHVHLANPLSLKYKTPIYMSELEIEFYNFHCEQLIPIRVGQVFKIGSLEVKPIFTPGHTKGSVCYLIGNNLFTGDVLFNEGCGTCNGTGGDPTEMFKSLNTIKSHMPLDTRIYPGHSYGTPPGQMFSTVLLNNIYLNIDTVEKFVAFRMRPKQTKLFNFH